MTRDPTAPRAGVASGLSVADRSGLDNCMSAIQPRELGRQRAILLHAIDLWLQWRLISQPWPQCEGCHRVYEADRALVTRMRAGEQRAFDEFFKACAPRLVAFIARRSSLDPATL